MNKKDTDPSFKKRLERRQDNRKKIRVIIKYSANSIYESFTYDLSNTGLFVLTKSNEILSKIKTNMTIKFYLEYKFDTIIEGLGKVVRTYTNDETDEKTGFAIHITAMSENNKVLLQNILSQL